MQKFKKPLIFLVKLLISAAALAYVVFRLKEDLAEVQGDSFVWFTFLEAFSGEKLFLPVFTLFLMPFNWGLEATKWRILMRPFYPNLKFKQAFPAVLAGLATGIFTPNRIGEYAGRVLWLEEGKRVEAVVVTFFDRICQMVITACFGGLALVFFALNPEARAKIGTETLSENGWLLLGGLTIFLILAMLGLLFYPEPLRKLASSHAHRHKWIEKVAFALGELPRKTMRTILALSLLRYLVFSLQFLLLIEAFHYSPGGKKLAEVPLLLTAQLVFAIFFLKSIVPSIGLGELGIRESVAVALMTPFGFSATTAFLATAVLYLINMILPTLAGAVLVFRLRLRGKKDEEGKG